MNKLHNLLTEEQIAKVRAPLDAAYWLPNKAFTSRDFFALEATNIFAKTWMSIGFSAEAPNNGDAYPSIILGDMPIVIVRDEKGVLRVFHNVCPRDGCLAIWSQKKSLGYILGIYHGWTWNLDGSLRNATLYDGKQGVRTVPENRDANLREIRSAEWQGTIFINLSGNAQSFQDYISPVEELYASVDLSNLTPGMNDAGTEVVIDRYTFESNWKNVYENFAINVNHEGFVHRDYKESLNVPRVNLEGKRTFEEVDDRGYHGLKFSEHESDIAYGVARTPKIPLKNGGQHDWNTIMTLYPNTNISLFPNFLLITVLKPQAPDQTGYDSMVLYPESVASNPRYAERREFHADWKTGDMLATKMRPFSKKYRWDVESPAFDQHFLVPFWDSMSHGFCNKILDDLEND